ncbi:MAG: hypothetical protein IJ389_04980 [Clostridia bacterium]|nr:hypothetical protein [Clostridia bacterium]
MKSVNASKRVFAIPQGCKPLSTGVAVALTAVSGVVSGAFPSNYGGMMFLAIAIGLFSYVMTASFSFLYIGMGALISVAVAMLCGVKFPLALISLIYIPIAFAISGAVRKRAGLSQTVAVATMTSVAIIAVIAGICYICVKDAFTDALTAVWSQYEEMMYHSAQQMNSTPAGVVISDTLINEIIHTTLMVLPSVAVLCCMGICYIGAKLFRLATVVSDSNELFDGGRWPITASLAGSVVFIASYLVTMFTFNSEIVYFSAINILYIILPSQAIEGFRLMFGRRSPVKLKAGWMRVLLTALCVYLIFYNPVMLLMVAASFTSFYNIRVWLIAQKKKREDEDDN